MLRHTNFEKSKICIIESEMYWNPYKSELQFHGDLQVLTYLKHGHYNASLRSSM